MGAKIEGEKELLDELEKRFGKDNMQNITDNALLAGAKVFVKELESQMSTFKDTGASVDEITIGDPEWQGDNRIVRIYWKGSKNRYRIIHLNEWGTVKNPNPDGKGKIASALRNAESEYIKTVQETLKEGIG